MSRWHSLKSSSSQDRLRLVSSLHRRGEGLEIKSTSLQWPPLLGECNFVPYRGLALSQGLICTKRVHLGHSKVAFIEGVLMPEGGGGGGGFDAGVPPHSEGLGITQS